MYTLILYRDRSVLWRWRLKSHNGRIVAASSQNFSTKQAAENNFELTRECDYHITGN